MSRSFRFWTRCTLVATLTVLITFNPAWAGRGIRGWLKKRSADACCPAVPQAACCQPAPVCCEPVPVCEPAPLCCGSGVVSDAPAMTVPMDPVPGVVAEAQEPDAPQPATESPSDASPVPSAEATPPAADPTPVEPAPVDLFDEPAPAAVEPAPAAVEPAPAAVEPPSDDLFGEPESSPQADLFGEPAPADPFGEATEPAPAEPAASDPFGGATEPAVPAETEPFDPFGAATEPAVADPFGETPAAPPAPADFFNDSAPATPATDVDDFFGDPAPASTDAAPDSALDGIFDAPPPGTADEPAAGDDFFGQPTSTETVPTNDLDDLFGTPRDDSAKLLAPEPASGRIVAPQVEALADTTLGVPQVVSAGDDPQLVRTWVDNTGTFEVVGKLAVIFPDKIRLLKENGHYCTVPMRRLSDADRQRVERIANRLPAGDVKYVSTAK